MTLRRSELDALRSLLPLRPSDDLTDDEARRVDEALRYSEECRNEVAAYEDCLSVLRSVSAEPTPMDDRPSLWNRIEPRLGPAGKLRRPRLVSWISTPQLAAACVVLSLFNLSLLTPAAAVRPKTPSNPVASPRPLPGDVPGILQAGNEWETVDPEFKGVISPIFGATVAELDRRHAALDGGGVVVRHLIRGASSEIAGLQPEDIITHIDGHRIQGPNCLRTRLSKACDGQQIQLTVLRNGREHRITVCLGGVCRWHPEAAP